MGDTSPRPFPLAAGGRKLLSALFGCFSLKKKNVHRDDHKLASDATGAFTSSGTMAATTELMDGDVIVVSRGAANKPAAIGGGAASFTSNNVALPEVVDGLSGGSPTEPPPGAGGAAFTSSEKAPAEASMDDGLVTHGDGGAPYLCSHATTLSDLTDDLIEEILLCLSPKERECRERASLVCKSWNCIVSSAGYRHRYFDLHRRYLERRQVVYYRGIYIGGNIS